MTLNSGLLLQILPLIILAGGAILVMLGIAIRRNYLLTFLLTLLVLIATFISVMAQASVPSSAVTSLLVADGFSYFYIGLITIAAILITLISYSYFKSFDLHREEYYVILLISTLGSAILASSQHFISLFLGLEILSVGLYALISYNVESRLNIEGGIKYLVLAGASSAFLLFGISLLYAATGTLHFAEIAAALGREYEQIWLFMAGFGLLIVGVGFKLAVVPFHMWSPDVYDAAPAPVSAFIASISKGGVIAVFVRAFILMNGQQYNSLLAVLGIIAVASMFFGNWLALRQSNIKRILAYSSIAHLGYILVAFVASGALGVEAITFYLVAYFITIIGAFGVVAYLSEGEKEPVQLERYRGLYWTKPWLAAGFTAILLSLAGIPLTAGFIGKYYVIAAGASHGFWALVIILILNSVIGLFYYLRVIATMFDKADKSAIQRPLQPTSWIALATVTILLVWFGVNPAGLIRLIQAFSLGV